MKTVLVIGKLGQVGRELSRVAPEGVRIVAVDRDEVDFAGSPDFSRLIGETGAQAVVNAAAYTAVDRAESEPGIAFAINRDAPGALAKACAAVGAPLVHYSTDYVFDGRKPEPYVETDPKNPINVYGRSKAEGEDAVLSSGARCSILRTSWVYAAHGVNFVRTMLRLAESQDEVRVVDDQVGRPTWARDLAEAAFLAIGAMESGASPGVLHIAGEGDASWADFAEAVFQHAGARLGRRPRLTRIPTADYPTPARRPLNSRLDTGRIAEVLGWQARPWRYSLAACLSEIEQGA